VTSGEWRVTSLKKKQIPRLRRPTRSQERTRKKESACSARNDNLRGVRRVVGVGAEPMRVVEADLQRSPDLVGTSSDRPLPAERIRRSWQAGKVAAKGPVVRLGEVAPRLCSG
jgi:hypothetical protein